MALPIIEYEPSTALIFVAMYFTIGLGMMNLITAVMVEASQRAREKDHAQIIRRKEAEFQQAQTQFEVICADMDKDSSGTLTLDELFHGYDAIQDFSSTMKVMDVAREDMGKVFAMLDEDDSGHVTYHELASGLHKMKMGDERTVLMMLEFSVAQVHKDLHYLHSDMTKTINEIHAMHQEVHQSINEIHAMHQEVHQSIRQTSSPDTIHSVEKFIGSEKADIARSDIAKEVDQSLLGLGGVKLAMPTAIESIGGESEKILQVPRTVTKCRPGDQLSGKASENDSQSDDSEFT
eukprot:gnl/TRDRNA2_/TRDRNA2_141716_c1_seq1.p1 gnl/TRDRNA2_/TRDRNA2_141716_c1~~gnl/TRDRNA2_/TRDRNA2_141716_c1_seq1.p1  ORF type:complete len:292 (+),score=44.92 gnl/TRDRNA2_/TRDRNA2_141716_c1_seq1:3-878(+)